MTSPPWFRFYSEILTDRKIDRVCRITGQPKVVVVGTWSFLMALASDSPIRGALLLTVDIPFTLDDLAAEMQLDKETTGAIIQEFARFDMVHQEAGVFYLSNWDKRQFSSDSSTERVRRFRERQRNGEDESGDDTETPDPEACNADETLHERYSNAPEQSRSESDTESDTEQKELSAAEPVAPASQPPANAGATRTTSENDGNGQPRAPTEHQAMFSALAEGYRLDLDLLTRAQRGRLNALSKRLRDADYTADGVALAFQDWYARDWRGQRGEPPSNDGQFMAHLSKVQKAQPRHAGGPQREMQPWE